MMRKIGLRANTIIDESTRSVWLLRAWWLRKTPRSRGHCRQHRSDSGETIDTNTRRVEAILAEVSLTLQRIDIDKAMEDAQAPPAGPAPARRVSRHAFARIVHASGGHPRLGKRAGFDAPKFRRMIAPTHWLRPYPTKSSGLDGFIHSLLNATRVTAGDVSPHLEWADPRDIINAAIKGRARRLAAHKVETEFAEDLPLVNVDSGLIEESCGQLLENAAKYSPSGSKISVNARCGTGSTSSCRFPIWRGITPGRTTATSAADRSEASAIRRRFRARASASGSRPPSSGQMAARSTS